MVGFSSLKLRLQLFLIACLVFLLPVILWHYLSDLGGTIKQNRLQNIRFSTQLIAQYLYSTNSEVFVSRPFDPEKDISPSVVNREMSVDGFSDDWRGLPLVEQVFFFSSNPVRPQNNSSKVVLYSAMSKNYLYLFFNVEDSNPVFHDPTTGSVASGDRLMLYFDSKTQGMQKYLIRAIAPGLVNSLQEISESKEIKHYLDAPNIEAYWELSATGYSIELKIPLPSKQTQLGFTVVDIERPGSANLETWAGTVDPGQQSGLGRILQAATVLRNQMESLVQEGSRLRLFDRNGRLVVDVNKYEMGDSNLHVFNPKSSSFIDAFIYRVFSYWFEHEFDSYESLSYEVANNGQMLLQSRSLDSGGDKKNSYKYFGAAEPLLMNGELIGMLLLEIKNEEIVAVMSGTLVRMFSGMLLTVLGVVLSLVAFASWLSYRILKISDAAAAAVKSNGEIHVSIPSGGAMDEVGDLSRSISDLLKSISSYTSYLRSLASKLSHELYTPLAVVTTSLENISQENFSTQNKMLLNRAEKGAKRLQKIIHVLSEANNLQQIARNSKFEAIDLIDWLSAVEPMYQDLYPDRQVDVVNSTKLESIIFLAVPDLLQQLLDKLMSNARDFSPTNGLIEVSISQRGAVIKINVFNQGPPIDPSIQTQIFDALVSRRSEQVNNSTPHLGMGLHIVKIIADAHSASVSAHNNKDRAGVDISVRFFQEPQ